MGYDNASGNRLLLFYCSFTCIYFPGILILLKFNNNLYNVGTYKFIPILIILMFAEVIKLSFSLLQADHITLGKNESRFSSRSKRSWTKNLRGIFKFCIAMITLSVIYFIVIILFGAPLLTHHEETIMLALTLTALTFIPASLHLGIDNALALLTGAQPQNAGLLLEAMRINVKATLLGSWLGATVIPLDWDRPWQAWPIPCITGALVGYMMAHFITLIKTLPVLKLNKKLHR
ncbi:phosphatidylinositol-glycan biosynthesis class F protein [Cephus cinctus]|uniref:Phosphatidylinositol-glycan biosynthesis class F protein n=1 Tax=Cephus cinctus TaxID=211228 RepID=A0AAJ7BNA9_CEPCN|nr:phosphatidylinositol-glycan biosynthesis class F protein [Cephus cinctus]XP_015589550.1 phosphatidylinositol-glycan biosynthesis class F protein [Cephus cinctus]XP_015589551.1 phosphatidylinositol-glycan biosynthesis class F protein [Cephus cinctus]